MAKITIRCTDGTIQLGGNFQETLDRVKAVAGRRYDSTSKTWAVPVSMGHFTGYDVVHSLKSGLGAGDHVSRYGNIYEAREWQGMRAADKAKTAAAHAFVPEKERREAEAKEALRTALVGVGCSAEAVKKLIALDYRFWGAVEDGHLRFSSPARKAAVEAAFTAYEKAGMAIEDAAMDVEQAAEERAYDTWGIK